MDEDDLSAEEMEVELDTGTVDQHSSHTGNPQQHKSTTQNDTRMTQRESTRKSVLGKRKTYKDEDEEDDDDLDPSEQKREKMGLRSRKRRNYSEETYIPPDVLEGKINFFKKKTHIDKTNSFCNNYIGANEADWEPMPKSVPAATTSSSTTAVTPVKTTVAAPKEEWIPRVEKILAHKYTEKGEIEYYVKWKNQSYLHASWVGPDEFEHERYSKRKLIRYHKKEELLYDEADEIFNPSFLEVSLKLISNYTVANEK